MCALWQPEHFAQVADLEAWESDVAEDAALVRHMQEGAFVPINIGGDGIFQVTVRGGQGHAGLSEREARYVLVSSQPYLLDSHGTISLGGLESVGGSLRQDSIKVPIESGRYSVSVHLVDWKAEPGAFASTGKPSRNALPDFIVEVNDELVVAGYRTAVNTFDRP
jgi:hypothetical protein